MAERSPITRSPDRLTFTLRPCRLRPCPCPRYPRILPRLRICQRGVLRRDRPSRLREDSARPLEASYGQSASKGDTTSYGRFVAVPLHEETDVLPTMPSMTGQVFALLVLALSVASIAWTVTHEELLREFRDFCAARSRSGGLLKRKFFYVFTCEYCFSHYVALVALAATGYRLLWPDWRGVVVAGFALVWIANLYMSLFGRLRLDIKHERVDIAADEQALAEPTSGTRKARPSGANGIRRASGE